MPDQPSEFVKVRRRRKTGGGANIYINKDILCRALDNAGIDCGCMNLRAKAFAAKDGKRAQIMIRISVGDARKFTRKGGVKWITKSENDKQFVK